MMRPEEDVALYPCGYGDEAFERLETQHRVWLEENYRLPSRAVFHQCRTPVDPGCRPGLTTLDLTRQVGPKGRIIAVDRDWEKSIPRWRAAAGNRGGDPKIGRQPGE